MQLAILSDTHCSEKEMTEVIRQLRDAELDGIGTPGTYNTETGATTSGVLIVWDPAEIQIDEKSVRTIQEGRIVTAHAHILRDAREFDVIGCYMPCRSSCVDNELEHSWDLLDDAVGESSDAIVGGDLNAEPPSWLDAHGKQRRNGDRRFEELLEEQDMCALLRDQATYRTGTLLDNWVVRTTTSGHFGAPLTLPGVCGKDHKIAVISYYYSNGDLKQRVERPTCAATRLVEKEDWVRIGMSLRSKQLRGGDAGFLAHPSGNKLHAIDTHCAYGSQKSANCPGSGPRIRQRRS